MIKCPSDSFIQVTWTNCHLSSKIIAWPQRQTWCTANATMNSIRKQCNGLSYCDLKVLDTKIQQRTCPINNKYLLIRYTCERKTQSGNINCPKCCFFLILF